MNVKKAAGDVKYEIDMFRFTADGLSNPNLPQAVINVFVESFAIHTRNLFFFFYARNKSRKKDDVIAEDYVMNKKLFITQRTKKSLLNYIVKRVAKQVAHITYHRAVYNKRTKPWKTQDIRNKMDKTINAFINSLPEKQKILFR